MLGPMSIWRLFIVLRLNVRTCGFFFALRMYVAITSPYLRERGVTGLFTGADLALVGFGKEARDSALFFVLPRRQLAVHSALVPALRLRTLLAPLGVEAA